MKDRKQTAGAGGSTVVRDGNVEHTSGTLNPGDEGYKAAFEKVPVSDKDRPGAFNRAPSFRDLEERPAKSKAATPAAGMPSTAATHKEVK